MNVSLKQAVKPISYIKINATEMIDYISLLSEIYANPEWR
jgi:hypothetical protein